MSLLAYPACAPAYAHPTMDPAHAEYPVSYPSAGQLQVPRAFAVGSSLGADHLEHPHCPPRYFHARGTQLGGPSTAAPQYSGTSSSATATRYATGVPISGYGARAAFSSRPAGRTWDRDAPASANEVQGRAVHGHASEALLPLRYSAAAAASRSAPSPVMGSSSSSSGSGSGVFKSGEGIVVASPTPQVPLPAQMAILLNDGGNGHRQDDSYGDTARPRAFDNLRMPVSYAVMFPNISEPATEGELEDDADAIEEGFLSREKKHGCTMCHKRSGSVQFLSLAGTDKPVRHRFDRPSTLKKHLLVHTGEKAFQCAICERRFGVMSNLNRHIRRCSLREVHTHGSAAVSALAASSPESFAPVATGKRGRTPPPAHPDDAPPRAPRKRRRRPPSPSHWIPASLRSFNILAPELNAPAPVPLHPVSPSRARPARRDSESGSDGGLPWDEERDSWDENFGRAPYHPREWDKTHRLPGPRVVQFGGAVGGNYSGDAESGPGGGATRVRSHAVMV
ncbi:hypothetical protein DFH09DRAFT_1436251 [Mycena vulgaris]|nr:hypothetical protein DFH09DRAFT_1436251 [Mycena vulgaris]